MKNFFQRVAGFIYFRGPAKPTVYKTEAFITTTDSREVGSHEFNVHDERLSPSARVETFLIAKMLMPDFLFDADAFYQLTYPETDGNVKRAYRVPIMPHQYIGVGEEKVADLRVVLHGFDQQGAYDDARLSLLKIENYAE